MKVISVPGYSLCPDASLSRRAKGKKTKCVTSCDKSSVRKRSDSLRDQPPAAAASLSHKKHLLPQAAHRTPQESTQSERRSTPRYEKGYTFLFGTLISLT